MKICLTIYFISEYIPIPEFKWHCSLDLCLVFFFFLPVYMNTSVLESTGFGIRKHGFESCIASYTVKTSGKFLKFFPFYFEDQM